MSNSDDLEDLIGKTIKWTPIIMAVQVVLSVVVIGFLVWVAVHFIGKYW